MDNSEVFDPEALTLEQAKAIARAYPNRRELFSARERNLLAFAVTVIGSMTCAPTWKVSTRLMHDASCGDLRAI